MLSTKLNITKWWIGE